MRLRSIRSLLIPLVIVQVVTLSAACEAWEQYLHGSDPNQGEEIAVGLLSDGAGSVFASGQLDDPASTDLYAETPALVKLSLIDGAEIWRKTGIGSARMFLLGGALVVGGIRVDPSTGDVLSGTFPGAEFLPDASGNVISTDGSVFTVTKYNGATFAPIWTSPVLGSGTTGAGSQLAHGPGSALIVAGITAPTPNAAAWVVSRLSDGGSSVNVDWTQELTNGGNTDARNRASALAVASDGTVFVGGTLVAPDAVPDVVVKRLNSADGHVEWTYSLRGTMSFEDPSNGVNALALTPDGDVIFAGQTMGELGVHPECNGGATFVVTRLSGATGSVVWRYAFNIGCSYGTGATDVQVDGSGGVYVAGTLYVPDAGGIRYPIVLRLDATTGQQTWARSYLGGSDGRATRLILDGTAVLTAGTADGGFGRDFFVSALSIVGGEYPCGNGVIDAGESCDDSNADSCDGCDSHCQVESGWLCGDGQVNAVCGEQCDDANTVSGDGCSSTCQDQAKPVSVKQDVAAGGTVSTDSQNDGATASQPIETSVTTPVAGTVSIHEATSPSVFAPVGYALLSQVITINAPAASAAAPLQFAFRLDGSRIPAGETPATLTVFRDGEPILDCTGASGFADPDPCVSSRTLQGDDAEFVVLSSHASQWYLAAARTTDLPVRVKHLAIVDSDTNLTKRSLTLKLNDPAIVPVDLSCTGPSGGGATLDLFGTGSGNHVTLSLPCAGWKRLGKHALTGSHYSDTQRAVGPCSKATIQRKQKSGVFTLQCSGKNPLQPFGYDLTGAGEGGVRFVLHAGQGVLCGTASHSGIPGTPGDNQVDFSFTDGKTGVAIVPSSCPN